MVQKSTALFAFALVAAVFALASAQPIPLTYNSTTSGVVTPFNWTYYSLTLTNIPAPAHIVVKTVKGDAFVFAALGRLPTLTNYDWKDTSDLVLKDIEVPITPENVGKKLFIGVYGYAPNLNSEFTVRAFHFYGAPLTAGVPVLAVMNGTTQSAYYSFVVPPHAFDLTVVAVGDSGDPDQYIGFGYIPTTDTYTYRNNSSGRSSCITVTTPPSGSYYYYLRRYSDGSTVFKTAFFINSRLGCNSLPGYKRSRFYN